MRRILTAAAATLILTATSCRPDKSEATMRTVSSADQVYELMLNDSLRISLNQCTGCADEWKVLYADSAVSVRDAGYIPDCNDCVGGSGNALFRVKARRTGEAKIGFGYFDDTVVFRIQVK